MGGQDIASFEEDGRRHDVRVRLEEHQRNNPEKLGTIQVRAADGRLVDMANVGEFRIDQGPVRIDRYDRARKLSIYANLTQGVALGTAIQTYENIVSEIEFPPDYSGQWQGRSKMMGEAAETIKFAFSLALMSLYMILAAQFNSFVQPAITMLTAPLSFIGAFALLSLSGMPLSVFAQLGLIALMGLVMKNGILLIDYANQMRAEGLGARDAMLKAGPIRLRPVLMTAVSTIFAMIPMATSTSDGAEYRTPMGILIIGGLASSTLLTLLVIPVAYSLVEDSRKWVSRLFGGAKQTQEAPQKQLGE